ncbi:DUF5675 family protein [Mangrovibacter phragmitis]|uniref:DUF5675 family protein n=1 Tax=Mangrovibacter phragmitis TaxID=1691903 RepID=UPI00336A0715
MAKYTIFVKRIWQTDNSTISTYEISGSKIKGYILERPGPDTKTSGLEKRIPEGVYNLKWHNSNIPSVKKYNPVPLLHNADVPVSRYILIHNGNYPRDTEGCLLVGGSKGVDFVGASVVKLTEIKEFIAKEGIDNFVLSISSCYSTCKA